MYFNSERQNQEKSYFFTTVILNLFRLKVHFKKMPGLVFTTFFTTEK